MIYDLTRGNRVKVFVSGISSVETTLAVRGFPVTYYPVDYPFFGINGYVAGSGYRTACGSKALGDDVEFLTLIGDDFGGRRIADAARGYGLSDKYILNRLCASVEAVVLQEIPFGRRQTYCDLKDVQDKTVDAEDFRAAIEACDVCALCNVNFNRSLIELAKKLGKPIATDVQALSDIHDEFNAQFIDNADILFLSDEGIPNSPEEFMTSLAHRCSAKIIVMGMGDAGVLYYERDKGEIAKLKAVSVGNVFTGGAGAALFSGFLHFYGKYDCVEALKRAEVFCALKLEGNASGATATDSFPTESRVEATMKTAGF